MAPVACDVENGLSAEDESCGRERPQGAEIQPKKKLRLATQAAQNTKSTRPRPAPASVRCRIFQTLGVGDGRTLSVDDDMVRKSPLTIIRTISIGFSTALPVITRPKPSNRTWVTL